MIRRWFDKLLLKLWSNKWFFKGMSFGLRYWEHYVPYEGQITVAKSSVSIGLVNPFGVTVNVSEMSVSKTNELKVSVSRETMLR